MADDDLILESNWLRQRVLLILQQPRLHDAIRVLNDETHDGGLSANTLRVLVMFRSHLNAAVLHALQDTGDDDDEQQILQDLRRLATEVLLYILNLWYDQPERVSLSDFTEVVVVPAPTAAGVAISSLEKQTFSAAAGGEKDNMECGICLEEFMDGVQVSVMPCQSSISHGRHKFHTDCITKWLEIRNTCPLCRHELHATGAGEYDQ